MDKVEANVNTKEELKKASRNKRKRNIIVILFVLIALIVAYIMFRGTYLEIQELGEQYISVFWKNFTYTISIFVSNFVLLYIIFYITNNKIKKGLKKFFDEEKREMPKLINKSISFIMAIVISFCVTNIIKEKLMLFLNSASFEMNDPILGYDIGYFVFQKPFIEFVILYLLAIVIGITIYTVIYYIVSFNMFFDGVDRDTLKNSHLLKQLFTHILAATVLIASYIFIKTQDVGLQKFLNLQDETSYSLWGAGLSDVTIKMWGYRILSLIIIISVFLAIRYFKNGQTKKVLISLGVVPTYLVGMFIVLLGFQAIFVNQNELDKEKDYIIANIQYTKNAYNLNIDEVPVEQNEVLTEEIVKQNEDVISNIPVVTQDVVLKNLNMLHTNKGYYSYNNTHISNISLGGTQNLVYVSPREILSSEGTYNNKTYEYTHGFGVIVTSATETDENGNLITLQKGFDNKDNVLNITEPRIYFGLETNETVITNSNTKKEFDYPVQASNTAENAENVYDGEAGLKLNFLDRLIMGIKENDLKLAFSSDIDGESKILINRNIIERAKTLLPYITYDENPYLVVTDEGRLVWVLDGYTTTDNYPYSQRITINPESLSNKKDINYIRNSVKVLIDAYDGTIKFYITDRNDPIIMAYNNIYKDLFVDKDEKIPEDISRQFIYPEYLYNIQKEIITRYHNVQPDVLYRGDDIWQIATHSEGKVSTKTGVDIEPYYTMLKTSDKSEAYMGLVLPFTPYEKQNIISYMVGYYENGEPKLKIYKYSQDNNILGTMQLDNQIEQDEDIAKEIESLNVAGTRISKDMKIVPINNSLLYVETIYQQYMNEENSLPTLKKVIVASGNKMAIGDNFEIALNNLLSQYAIDIEVENTDSIEDLVNAIIKANTNLKESNENNDWEMIGKDMNKLQELIEKLEQLIKDEEKNNKNQTDVNNTVNNEILE